MSLPIGYHQHLSHSQIRSLFENTRSLLEQIEFFPEWELLEKACVDLSPMGKVHLLGQSHSKQGSLPILGLSFGSTDPKAPVLGLYGGVHGLERIGSQVVLAYLNSFSQTLLWDQVLKNLVSNLRIVFLPIVNPWGVAQKSRSNPNGVDLMRNAPIDAESPTWLVGGHRYSNTLPWFRGSPNELEPEAKALIDFSKEVFFESNRVITLDFHSGFGTQDQLWFPYAKTQKPFASLAETHALFDIFEKTHPHHFYQIEPQSKHYTTHGDLWDYLYDEYQKKNPNRNNFFLPLALEMGSWLWVKKNPMQLFSPLGPYHPLLPHRHKRILRRHQTLLDFMMRALVSSNSWIPQSPEQLNKHHQQGLEYWYGK